MDVARAAMGHGWPTAAGLWSGDGVSEPWRSQGRMNGRRVLVTFACKSNSPGKAKRDLSAERDKQLEPRHNLALTKICQPGIKQSVHPKIRKASSTCTPFRPSAAGSASFEVMPFERKCH